MAWTTDDLVAAVKRKVMAPSSGLQYTDQELLDIAWEETMKRLVPAVRAVREDYWTTTQDYVLTSGVDTQRVPSRAAASTATRFWLVQTGRDPYPLRRLPAAERIRFANVAAGLPVAYALEGDTVHLLPVPGQAGLTMRVQYDRRPARYRPVSEGALISAIGATTLTTSGGSWSATEIVDVVQAESPFDVLLQSVSATYAAGTFTFGAGVLPNQGIAVGDYVMDAGYTCVLPMADVLHPVLVDMTAAQVLNDSGFIAKRDAVREDLADYMPGVIQQLAIRVSADPSYAFNRESPLRASNTGWGRGYSR